MSTEYFGLGFSFGMFYIFTIIAGGGIYLLTLTFGIGRKSNGGNSKRIKISKERKGDEK